MNEQDLIIVLIAGVIVFVLVGVFVIFFVLVYNKRKLEFQKQFLELEAQFQQEILTARLEVTEQTLVNVSQDLHDNIGQILTLAKVNINRLILSQRISEECMTDVKSLLTRAIQDVRDLSKSLNSDWISEIGLLGALRQEINTIGRAAGIMFKMDFNIDEPDIDRNSQVIVFRIIQEILNNSIKHSNASNVNICISQLGLTHLLILIEDDGRGFDVELQKRGLDSSGNGLFNIHRRALLLYGKVVVKSVKDVGTSISLEIPLKKESLPPAY